MFMLYITVLLTLSLPSAIYGAFEIDKTFSVEHLYFTKNPLFPKQEKHSYQNYKLEFSLNKYYVTNDVNLEGDLILYSHNLEKNLLDGALIVNKALNETVLSFGLKRDSWKKGNWHNFDILNPNNTVFSILQPEQSLSQLMVTTHSSFNNKVLDIYLLIGHRDQPFPDSNSRDRLSENIDTTRESDVFGHNALAFRLQQSTALFDVAVHSFYGLSRHPAIIAVPTTSGIPEFEATYQEIFQIGGEVETTVETYRLWSQFFFRHGFRDIWGDSQDYLASNIGIERQWFNLFEVVDLLAALEFNYDSRGKDSNVIFGKSVNLSCAILSTDTKPWGLSLSLSHDINFANQLYFLKLSKTLSETPFISLFMKYQKVTEGNSPNLHDIFSHDTQFTLGMYMEF